MLWGVELWRACPRGNNVHRMISRRTAVLGVLVGGSLLNSTVSAFAKSGRPGSFAEIDSNQDGTLDLHGIKKAAVALFDDLDTDQDGKLSRSQLRSRLSRKDFSSADLDNDRKLTKVEFLGIIEKRLKD